MGFEAAELRLTGGGRVVHGLFKRTGLTYHFPTRKVKLAKVSYGSEPVAKSHSF